MSNESILRTQQDYAVPLLRLLSKLADGENDAATVLRRFRQEYATQIPPEHFEDLESGNAIRWEKNVNFARLHLKKAGFLDGSERGIWRITEEGRNWIKENPHAERLASARNSSGARRGRKRRITTDRVSPPNSVSPGITFEMLEQTKSLIPPDQFRQIWGTTYDQLLAEERAKAITEVKQAELGQRACRKLDEIHAFLRGQHNAPPRSDVICDWIHFCYELELHREAASLWRYVREDEADSGYYRRAKKWAEASRARLGW